MTIEKKLLLVTFPVDLGNRTNEKRLISIFESHLDLRVHQFIPNQAQRGVPATKFAYTSVIARRFLGSYSLCREVLRAYQEGRKVLFHGISPALFAYPVIRKQSSYIVTDWTKKLYEPFLNASLSPNWLTATHREVMSAQRYVFGLTDAVIEEIHKDYQIPKSKLKKARLPFCPDLDLFVPSPERYDREIRLLFVGGDFQRKGGDVLLRWFKQIDNPNVKLTIVTKQAVESRPNLTVKTSVDYGQTEHINLFGSHDIFVLPTTLEGYPSVIGEAGCAGLAILTTKNALGAPEIIVNGENGYICSSQENLIQQLEALIQDKPMIESMKRKSRLMMEEKFAKDLVLGDFINCMFGNQA